MIRTPKIPKTAAIAMSFGLVLAVFGSIGAVRDHTETGRFGHSPRAFEQSAPLAKPNGVTDAKVTPISVHGPDKMVWLVYGEGYLESDQARYVSYLHKTFDKYLHIEPFSRFAQDINVYAVNTVSQTRYTNKPGQNTYFGLTQKANDAFPWLSNDNQRAQTKLNALKQQILSNYLDPGARVISETVLVGSVDGSLFRSYYSGGYSMISASNFPQFLDTTIVHEAAHHFGLD